MSKHEQTTTAVVPSMTSTAMTRAQAHALADLWVSEHNRLPLRIPRSDARDADAGWFVVGSRGDPGEFLNVLANAFSAVTHAVRRLVVRRLHRDGFALDRATERRLRRAFAEALQDPQVRAMTDADQRRQLGEVLFIAQQHA